VDTLGDDLSKANKIAAEAEGYLNKFIEEHSRQIPDLKVTAEKQLKALHFNRVGLISPEITAEDLDADRRQLSFRFSDNSNSRPGLFGTPCAIGREAEGRSCPRWRGLAQRSDLERSDGERSVARSRHRLLIEPARVYPAAFFGSFASWASLAFLACSSR
jgi:hypothetical protein